MYFELIPYLRSLWTRTVAKVLCYFGHHDYEFNGLVDSNPSYGNLICFNCEIEKHSFISRG